MDNTPPEGMMYWDPIGHPEHPLTQWQQEVENRDTRLGYWEWVNKLLEEESDEWESPFSNE